MKDYTIYFEINGKKYKKTVKAQSESAAKDIIRYSIIFHKVEEQKRPTLKDLANDLPDELKSLLNL